jgi:hypothetical protein
MHMIIMLLKRIYFYTSNLASSGMCIHIWACSKQPCTSISSSILHIPARFLANPDHRVKLLQQNTMMKENHAIMRENRLFSFAHEIISLNIGNHKIIICESMTFKLRKNIIVVQTIFTRRRRATGLFCIVNTSCCCKASMPTMTRNIISSDVSNVNPFATAWSLYKIEIESTDDQLIIMI